MASAGTGNFGQYLIRGLTGRITSAMATELRNWSEVDLRTRQVGNQSVKLNSRDYTSTSGEHNAVQSKPNVSVGGTTGITAFEASPRFASGIAGGKLVGYKSNPDLKGSSAGTLSGPVRCYEAKFDGGSGRTVDSGYVLDCMTSNASTMTNGCFIIGASAAGGGGTGWTGFMRARTSGAGGLVLDPDGMAQDPITAEEEGYLNVYIGTTQYQIPIYAMS